MGYLAHSQQLLGDVELPPGTQGQVLADRRGIDAVRCTALLDARRHIEPLLRCHRMPAHPSVPNRIRDQGVGGSGPVYRLKTTLRFSLHVRPEIDVAELRKNIGPS